MHVTRQSRPRCHDDRILGGEQYPPREVSQEKYCLRQSGHKTTCSVASKQASQVATLSASSTANSARCVSMKSEGRATARSSCPGTHQSPSVSTCGNSPTRLWGNTSTERRFTVGWRERAAAGSSRPGKHQCPSASA